MANPLSILAPAIARLRVPIKPKYVPVAKAAGAAPEVQQFIQNRAVEQTTPFVNKQKGLSAIADVAPLFIKNTPAGIIAGEMLAPSYANALDDVTAIKNYKQPSDLSSVKYQTLKDMNRIR